MIFDLAVTLTWIAAGYRTWILFRQPPTIWRVSFSVAMLCTALSFTAYRFQAQIDQMTGLYNVGELVSRFLLLIGIGFVMIYLDALRKPLVTTVRTATYLSAVSVAAAVLVLSWSFASVHDQPIADLFRLAADPAVVVYCVSFWACLGWAAIGVAYTCLSPRRTFRRDDPARSVCLLLIGSSALASILVILAWSTSIVYHHITGRPADHLKDFGDRLLPWPMLVNAIGVLALVTLPYALDTVVTQRRWRRLRPLWRDLVNRYPEVHLRLDPSGGPLSRMRTREERAIIEISDALQLAQVDLDLIDGSVESLGVALRIPVTGGRAAATLLPRTTTRREDIQQMVALADAYEIGRR